MIGHDSFKAPTSPKMMDYKKTEPRAISQGKKAAKRTATSSKYVRTKEGQSKTGTPQGSMGYKKKPAHPPKKTTLGTKTKRHPKPSPKAREKTSSKSEPKMKESYEKSMDSYATPKKDTKGKETRRPRKDRRPKAKSKASDSGAKKRAKGLRRAMKNKRLADRKSTRSGLIRKRSKR